MDEKELRVRQAQKVFCIFQASVISTAVSMSKAVSGTSGLGPMFLRFVFKSLHSIISVSVQTTRKKK